MRRSAGFFGALGAVMVLAACQNPLGDLGDALVSRTQVRLRLEPPSRSLALPRASDVTITRLVISFAGPTTVEALDQAWDGASPLDLAFDLSQGEWTLTASAYAGLVPILRGAVTLTLGASSQTLALTLRPYQDSAFTGELSVTLTVPEGLLLTDTQAVLRPFPLGENLPVYTASSFTYDAGARSYTFSAPNLSPGTYLVHLYVLPLSEAANAGPPPLYTGWRRVTLIAQIFSHLTSRAVVDRADGQPVGPYLELYYSGYEPSGIELSWPLLPEALSYQIERRTSSTGSFTVLDSAYIPEANAVLGFYYDETAPYNEIMEPPYTSEDAYVEYRVTPMDGGSAPLSSFILSNYVFYWPWGGIQNIYNELRFYYDNTVDFPDDDEEPFLENSFPSSARLALQPHLEALGQFLAAPWQVSLPAFWDLWLPLVGDEDNNIAGAYETFFAQMRTIPSYAPYNLNILALNPGVFDTESPYDNGFVITWDPVDRAESYDVEWIDAQVLALNPEAAWNRLTVTSPSVEITGLAPAAVVDAYETRLRAVNGIGATEWNPGPTLTVLDRRVPWARLQTFMAATQGLTAPDAVSTLQGTRLGQYPNVASAQAARQTFFETWEATIRGPQAYQSDIDNSMTYGISSDIFNWFNQNRQGPVAVAGSEQAWTPARWDSFRAWGRGPAVTASTTAGGRLFALSNPDGRGQLTISQGHGLPDAVFRVGPAGAPQVPAGWPQDRAFNTVGAWDDGSQTVIAIGSSYGGLLATWDGGSTWTDFTEATTGNGTFQIFSVGQISVQGSTILALVTWADENFSAVGSGALILEGPLTSKVVDPIANPFTSGMWRAAAPIGPTSFAVLYQGSGTEYLSRLDFATTPQWTTLQTFTIPEYGIDVTALPDGTGFLLTSQGLYKTTNAFETRSLQNYDPPLPAGDSLDYKDFGAGNRQLLLRSAAQVFLDPTAAGPGLQLVLESTSQAFANFGVSFAGLLGPDLIAVTGNNQNSHSLGLNQKPGLTDWIAQRPTALALTRNEMQNNTPLVSLSLANGRLLTLRSSGNGGSESWTLSTHGAFSAGSEDDSSWVSVDDRQVTGPNLWQEADRVTAFTSGPERWFVNTRGSGLWQSTDLGANWLRFAGTASGSPLVPTGTDTLTGPAWSGSYLFFAAPSSSPILYRATLDGVSGTLTVPGGQDDLPSDLMYDGTRLWLALTEVDGPEAGDSYLWRAETPNAGLLSGINLAPVPGLPEGASVRKVSVLNGRVAVLFEAFSSTDPLLAVNWQGGDTWTVLRADQAEYGSLYGNVKDVRVLSPDLVLVATGNGLFYSASWHRFSPDQHHPGLRRFEDTVNSDSLFSTAPDRYGSSEFFSLTSNGNLVVAGAKYDGHLLRWLMNLE